MRIDRLPNYNGNHDKYNIRHDEDVRISAYPPPGVSIPSSHERIRRKSTGREGHGRSEGIIIVVIIIIIIIMQAPGGDSVGQVEYGTAYFAPGGVGAVRYQR